VRVAGLSLIFIFFLLPRLIFSQEERTESGNSLEISRRLELIRLFTEGGIPFEVRPLFSEYGGFGSSLVVYLPPKTKPEPDEGVFVLAIPLCSEDDPGKRFPYGLEAGLAFIKKARERDLKKEIWVAFLGDESSRLPPDVRKGFHTGLEDLLTLPENPENTIMLYADFHNPPEKILIHHSGGKTPAPLSLLQPIPGLCDSYGVPFAFAVTSNELYKLGVVEGPAVLGSSLAHGVPSLYLEGGGPTGEPIPAERLGDLLLGYTDALNFSAENLDYHYLIFQLGNKTVFVPELLTVIILWSLGALGFLIFLIYSIVLRRMMIIQWKIFFRRSWVIVILFVILFLTLQGSELFFSFLLSRFALPHSHISYGGILFTLSIALTLFSLIDPLFNRLKIPRRANFYGNAAVILIILGTLIAVFLDITFIPAFVWAFLFTVLAALIPFSLPVYVIACIIPLQIAGLLFTSMGTGGLGLRMLDYPHRLWPILFIAIVALPSVLVFKRASALAAGQKKRQPPFLWLVSRSIMLAGCMGALTFYVYNLSLESPVTPVRRLMVEDPANPAILDVTITSRSFLARRNLEINLRARKNPARFDLYLDSPSDPQPIYAASIPFIHREHKTEDSPREVTLEFILGENPPNPFTANIVLPRTSSGFLRVEALYTRYDPSLDPEPPPAGDDYVLRVTRTIPIGFGEN
jgi:hypothetical protein